MAQNKQQAQSKNQKKTEVKEKPLKDVPIQLKWFTPEGIKTEIKRIRWIKFPELLESTGKVLLFCILFGIFFVLCDLVISKALLMIGVGA
ncbi:MAG: preprotein translocase subunit SecE [Erysipelotrichaceae bacterium]|nr:preprotein translocase subunit SecE [Erysipelotrichaceae bacterium]